MKIDIDNNIPQKIDDLNKFVDNLAKGLVDDMSKRIARSAQLNFDRFIPEVPADFPEVRVYVHTISDHAKEIECVGNQVLFIEFGTGITNSMVDRISYKESWSGFDDKWVIKDMPARGFKFVDNELTEIAPRPRPPIVELGEYGKGQGMNDYWLYRGWRESNNSQEFLKRKGKGVMITKGNPPARALYRAIRNAVRRLSK